MDSQGGSEPVGLWPAGSNVRPASVGRVTALVGLGRLVRRPACLGGPGLQRWSALVGWLGAGLLWWAGLCRYCTGGSRGCRGGTNRLEVLDVQE